MPGARDSTNGYSAVNTPPKHLLDVLKYTAGANTDAGLAIIELMKVPGGVEYEYTVWVWTGDDWKEVDSFNSKEPIYQVVILGRKRYAYLDAFDVPHWVIMPGKEKPQMPEIDQPAVRTGRIQSSKPNAP